MTKIIAVSSAGLMCHGADRLVSAGGSSFDPLANKTLVYSAPDALAAISYTGSAYLEDLPTDEWLARALTGIDEEITAPPGFTSGASTWRSQRYGPLPRWPDVGGAAHLLAQELESVRPYLKPAETPPSLMITAVKSKRSRPNIWYPFVGIVEYRPSAGAYRAHFLTDLWSNAPFAVVEMPMPHSLDATELASLWQSVLSAQGDPRRTEDEVVNALRIASAKSPGTIGEDAMSISVSARTGRLIRVRFHSQQGHNHAPRRARRTRCVHTVAHR